MVKAHGLNDFRFYGTVMVEGDMFIILFVYCDKLIRKNQIQLFKDLNIMPLNVIFNHLNLESKICT